MSEPLTAAWESREAAVQALRDGRVWAIPYALTGHELAEIHAAWLDAEGTEG